MSSKLFSTFFSVVVLSGFQAQNTVGLLQHDAGTLDDGYVLFAPMRSTTTYLIDKCGKEVNSWTTNYKPALSCYLLPDGALLRTGNTNSTSFTAGGSGGVIEKIDWNGSLTWSYTISNSLECQHHDVKALPNGNVLAIVWESKTSAEAIAEGRNPALTTTRVLSEKIIEIQPTGATTGTIVWEWKLWDHMVQDFDNSKPNYSTIAANPQLLNINFQASATNEDWIHLNSIDYNAALDQILVSSHSFSEVWVIDHSVSSAEAAGHTGGNSGKGGDIIYRWGNPRAYANGTVSDQKLFAQHDANWIESNFPFENQIMIFNNGTGRTGGNYSTVEIINPPVNGFNYTATLPYLPQNTSWNYNNGNPNSFYAQNISGAQQLGNGNVLICDGPAGVFTEVNSAGQKVWQYTNPVSNSGILNQGSIPAQNLCFRSVFYPTNFSGFSGQALTVGTIIEDNNSLSATCVLSLSLLENNTIENTLIYPNPCTDQLTIQSSVKDLGYEYSITNHLGQTLISGKITSTSQTIKLDQLQNGNYLFRVNGKVEAFSVVK
tara:strand:- start:15514 stop:17151 length:1638 start_codon:yes stop_codon:yes gene_type:complete